MKTKAHRESLWQVEPEEAAELGPFLARMSGAVVGALGAERVYVKMWVDKPPLHVHLVLFPRFPDEPERGPDLDAKRYAAGPPSDEEAAAAAERLRSFLAEA